MPVIDGVKYSCSACIKGHRSSNCPHADRQLFEVQKKGRPPAKTSHKRSAPCCECAKRVEDEDSDLPARKRSRGRNSKALLAIERAVAKGAVICGCGNLECSCEVDTSSLKPQGSTSAHLLADEAYGRPFPVPSMTQSINGSSIGGVSSPLLESAGWMNPSTLQAPASLEHRASHHSPAFHAYPPIPPPSYYAPFEQGFSLGELSQAASCQAACRPGTSTLDPFVAQLLTGLDSAQTLVELASTAETQTGELQLQTSGCSCGKDATTTALQESPNTYVCQSCGPACRCGTNCACGKVSTIMFPPDCDIDELLRDLLNADVAPIVPVEKAVVTTNHNDVAITHPKTDGPTKGCCCSTG